LQNALFNTQEIFLTMADPFYIQWHITNLCNLRCNHCYQEDFSKKSDLDGFGLKKVTDNILTTINEWNKTACIHLTGGEPFLKSEVFQLLKDLDAEPAVEELGIITNGTLLDEELMMKLSSFSKLKKIKISLDGATTGINDSIRPKGTFEKVIKNLAWVKKSTNFEIIFMFTAMKKNFRSFPSLLHLCQNLEVDGVIVERFIPWGRGREMMDEALGKEEWKELLETLSELFSLDMDGDPGLPYQAFQVIFNGEELELLGAPCVIGRDGLCIMPEGTVFPCRRFPISIGNLLNDSMKSLWEKSELLEKLRRKENLKGKCGSCGINDCRGCRSLALCLTGDYLEEDPHCPLPLRVSSSST
jgi:radical SAM protein with 4Fe4S-binding SPASM domain